jgi:nucleotide-binding universal stress UspA family protein
MLKAVLGVDAGGGYGPGLDLFLRLKFPDASVIAVSAVDTTPPIVSFVPEAIAIQADYVAQSEVASREELDTLSKRLQDDGIPVEAHLVYGGVVPVLVRTAEESKADLVVVHSTVRGGWETMFLGSVSRGLATGCPTSVLVSKGSVGTEGEVTAVFATDHSEYANRALA